MAGREVVGWGCQHILLLSLRLLHAFSHSGSPALYLTITLLLPLPRFLSLELSFFLFHSFSDSLTFSLTLALPLPLPRFLSLLDSLFASPKLPPSYSLFPYLSKVFSHFTLPFPLTCYLLAP